MADEAVLENPFKTGAKALKNTVGVRVLRAGNININIEGQEAGGVLKDVTETLGAAGEKVGKSIRDTGKGISGVAKGIGAGASAAAHTITDPIGNLATGVRGSMTRASVKAGETVAGVTQGIKGMVKRAAEPILALPKGVAKGLAGAPTKPLPVFNEGTMRYHDPETKRMVGTADAEKQIAEAGPKGKDTDEEEKGGMFSKIQGLFGKDKGLKDMKDKHESKMVDPLEGILTTIKIIAESLLRIEPFITGLSGDKARAAASASLAEAQGGGEDDDDDDDEGTGGKGPGFLKRTGKKIGGKVGGMFNMGTLLKTGLIVALTGIMAFADKFAVMLEPVLKWIKGKAWPAAIGFLMGMFTGVKDLITNLTERFKGIFGEDVPWYKRILNFFGIFKDLGAFILGVFDKLTEFVANLFGVSFKPYDGLASWIWAKITGVWTWIKGIFSWGDDEEKEGGEDAPKTGGLGTWIWGKLTGAWKWIKGIFSWGGDDEKKAEGEDGGWSIFGLISGIFTGIKEWFGKLFKFDSTSDIITSLVNVVTFVPNMIKDLISGATQWLLGLFGFDDASKKVANATDWTFGSLITGAFTAVRDWFVGLFSWGSKEEGETEGGGWTLTSLVTGVFTSIKTWFKKLFSFDSTSEVITSLINVLTFVPNILKDMLAGVTSWLLGIFGFGEASEKAANVSDWSIGEMIMKVFSDVRDWLIEKFTFDISSWEIGKKFMKVGDILMNFIGGLLPNPNKWLGKMVYKIPGTGSLKAAAEMYAAGGSIEGGQMIMPGGENDAAATLAAETAELNASTGGVVINDNSTNQSTSSSTQDTYQQAELATEHNESSASSGTWWNPFD